VSEERILEEILVALDRGEAPDGAALLGRFPGHEATIERLVKATARYRHLMRSVRTGDACDPGLQPGDRLGDFEIEDLIGRGGMGSVWRARQHSLGGRYVALKVLPVAATDASARDRFRREALLLADIHHPRLAEVHGFGEERGLVYFAMRLVEGPTLREVIERCGRPDSDLARRRCVGWIADVASALAVVHAAGLVHRDVKPSNVLIEDVALPTHGAGPKVEQPADAARWPDGPAVLVDFGLVRQVTADSKTLTSIGVATLPYAASEQILGMEVDARSDVFSLGVTLHDVLSGRLPHEAGRATGRTQATAGLPLLRQVATGVDDDLQAVVAKAADPDARWRYRDAAELHADLLAWLEGRAVSARRLRPIERAGRWVRSHPERLLRVLGVGIAAVLLVLASARWMGWSHAIDEVRQATRLGDLRTLGEAVKGLPNWGAAAWLGKDDIDGCVERLRANDPLDPLVHAVDRLAALDVDGALLDAATHLRVSGLASEPLLVRFLGASVDGPTDSHRPVALRLVARLLYEREPETTADSAAADQLRDSLRRAAMRELPPDDRLHVWTALSGCGALEDAERALSEALTLHAAGSIDEPWRIRLVAMERLVRRAHAGNALDSSRLRRIVELAGPMMRDVYARGVALNLPWKVREAQDRAAKSLVLAAVAAAVPPGASSLVPEDLQTIVPTQRGLVLTLKGLLLVAAGDAAPVDEIVARCRATATTCAASNDLGWVCGSLLDARRTSDARGVIAAQDLASFDEGLAAGERARSGRVDEYRPDDDTLLGAGTTSDAEWHPTTRSGTWSDRDVAAYQHLDAQSPAVAPLHPGFLAYGLTVSEVRWEFTKSDVVCMGRTLRLGGSAVDLRSDGAQVSYLRFAQPGTSCVRLAFEVDAAESDDVWKIVLLHQRGSRFYLPHKGDAPVEVELDGFLIGAAPAATFTESFAAIEVPPDRLGLGPHELVVRLGRTATTTYRLSQVELRRPVVR